MTRDIVHRLLQRVKELADETVGDLRFYARGFQERPSNVGRMTRGELIELIIDEEFDVYDGSES